MKILGLGLYLFGAAVLVLNLDKMPGDGAGNAHFSEMVSAS